MKSSFWCHESLCLIKIHLKIICFLFSIFLFTGEETGFLILHEVCAWGERLLFSSKYIPTSRNASNKSWLGAIRMPLFRLSSQKRTLNECSSVDCRLLFCYELILVKPSTLVSNKWSFCMLVDAGRVPAFKMAMRIFAGKWGLAAQK